MTPEMTPEIFICYAHKDNEHRDPNKRWLERLQECLRPLELQGHASVWVDLDIELGEEWHQNIQQTLEQIRVALLLVSPAFLASEYIRNSELPVLLRRAKDRELVIIPIFVRQCAWRETTFNYPDPKTGPYKLSLSKKQMPNGKPLNAMEEHEQDETFYKVYRRIDKIFNPPQVKSPTPTKSPTSKPPAPKPPTPESLEEEAQRNLREIEDIRANKVELDYYDFVIALKDKLPKDRAMYDLIAPERLREYIDGQRTIVLEDSREILQAARQVLEDKGFSL
ncbi:MAG: toll/interleukin-1 receptor domain-containing protein [Crocosphaera sp.]|nr:toll/interleukin-1 receptor domain-containing protein [Crocosphaera sp.]